jgi:hypothetical protein
VEEKNTKKAKNEGFQQMPSYHDGGASYHDAIGLIWSKFTKFWKMIRTQRSKTGLCEKLWHNAFLSCHDGA